MLICAFHCCNRSLPHRFMAISASYGLNLPTWPSLPIHLIHFRVCFTWDNVLIPRSFWNGQARFQESCEINVKSAPASTRPSVSIPSHRNFNFGLLSCIAVWQNICFLVSSESLVLAIGAALSLLNGLVKFWAVLLSYQALIN